MIYIKNGEFTIDIDEIGHDVNSFVIIVDHQKFTFSKEMTKKLLENISNYTNIESFKGPLKEK